VTATAKGKGAISAPLPNDTLDELVALLFDGLTSVDLLAERRRAQDWRVARRGRPCRCERPIPLADDPWSPGGRDLKCGRELRSWRKREA
jgi:hypothetical protein